MYCQPIQYFLNPSICSWHFLVANHTGELVNYPRSPRVDRPHILTNVKRQRTSFSNIRWDFIRVHGRLIYLGKQMVNVLFHALRVQHGQNRLDSLRFGQPIKLLTTVIANQLQNESKSKLWFTLDERFNFFDLKPDLSRKSRVPKSLGQTVCNAIL